MKVFIIITMIIFVIMSLQKNGYKSNFFELIFLTILVSALLILVQSWPHTVAALCGEATVIYATVDLDVSICQYPMYSLLCNAYYKFIIKGERVRYPDYNNNQFMKFSFMVVTIRSIVFLFLFFETAIYCYQLVANQIWWKWLIVTPVILILCVAGVIVGKNWFRLYRELY